MNSDINIVKSSEQQQLEVLGVKITILQDDEQKLGGAVTLQEGVEGVGPPPHSHEWDESFYILEGQVDINVDGKTITCTPGTFINLRGGVQHGFQFGKGGGRMLEIAGNRSHASAMFQKIDQERQETSFDIPKVIDILEAHGVMIQAPV